MIHVDKVMALCLVRIPTISTAPDMNHVHIRSEIPPEPIPHYVQAFEP